jgi:hypothetical protein
MLSPKLLAGSGKNWQLNSFLDPGQYFCRYCQVVLFPNSKLMNLTDTLVKQTESAYSWTTRLISSIPYNQWDRIPEIVKSNVTWQVGHLIMSYYYHSIMVIAGHQVTILQQVPLKEYDLLFTDAAPDLSVGKTNPVELEQQLQLVAQKSIEIIGSLTPADLESPLVPAPMEHPIASNKFEALDWNIKHTMWHCGQLGMLKRIVDQRFDFGLKRAQKKSGLP